MNYASGGDFRRALEMRLRNISLREHVPLARLRKLVAFDRFLARLAASQPEAWILKGGLALQIRLGERARTTRDMDLDFRSRPSQADIHTGLVEAASTSLGDWFGFQVEGSRPAESPSERFHARALLDGRPFETFHVDVGVCESLVEPPQKLSLPPLLEFAGIAPALAPCYPVTQQIAEKIHAYTRPHVGSEGSRVKDLVDILLLASLSSMTSDHLFKAIHATFETRQTHPIPRLLPNPPTNWGAPFRKLATETNLAWTALAPALKACREFIEPVLQGNHKERWNPIAWKWENQ